MCFPWFNRYTLFAFHCYVFSMAKIPRSLLLCFERDSIMASPAIFIKDFFAPTLCSHIFLCFLSFGANNLNRQIGVSSHTSLNWNIWAATLLLAEKYMSWNEHSWQSKLLGRYSLFWFKSLLHFLVNPKSRICSDLWHCKLLHLNPT